jgi:hypothetical protein
MEFAKGIKLNEKRFENGDAIVNMSLDMSQLMENPINNDRFINVTIKRSKKTEKLYAVINEYYSKKDNKVEETDGEIVQFGDEEIIPF